MSAPSRRPEIRRNRARKDKILALRRRYQNTTNESDRDQIFERVKRISPQITREQFAAPLEKRTS